MERSPIERRYSYRIRYPINARPFLTIEGEDYPVIDLCEKGVRFLKGNSREFPCGSIVRAILTLAHKARIELMGQILRVEREEGVIFLLTPIPRGKLMEEERYLANRFPGYR